MFLNNSLFLEYRQLQLQGDVHKHDTQVTPENIVMLQVYLLSEQGWTTLITPCKAAVAQGRNRTENKWQGQPWSTVENEGLVVLGLMFAQHQYVELSNEPRYITTRSLFFIMKGMLEIVTYLFTIIYTSVWQLSSLFYTDLRVWTTLYCPWNYLACTKNPMGWWLKLG